MGTHVSKLLTDEDIKKRIQANTPANPTICELCGWPGSALSLCAVCMAFAEVVQKRRQTATAKADVTIRRLRDYRDGGPSGQTL